MAKIFQVLKSETQNDVFIQKLPVTKEDFNTGSVLIVHESQEAIFLLNGQIINVYTAGKYRLTTDNIPIISNFLKRVFYDNESPFHCEIYFINLTEQMGINWGTDDKVEYLEPAYNFPIKVGASGEMNLRVNDSKLLLLKVVGTETDLTQKAVVQKFRSFLMIHLKPYLAKLLTDKNTNIFSIDQELLNISERLHQELKPIFLDYGLSLERFFVSRFVKPEEDRTYQEFKALHFAQYADVAKANLRQQVSLIDQETEAQRKIIDAQATATKRKLEGFTYHDERRFDVAQDVAKNEAKGEFHNLGVGLGMIEDMGGLGDLIKGSINVVVNDSEREHPKGYSTNCPKCGGTIHDGSKFCSNCGEKLLPANMIECPKCHAIIQMGSFCNNCGKKLVNNCAKCGSILEPDKKFCSECGTKVE